jgi:hypothetical protein
VNNAMAFLGGFMVSGALLIVYFAMIKRIASKQ